MAKLNGTQTGDIVEDRMRQLGWSIDDTAVAVGITYEHMRRVAKGEAVPGIPTLRSLCAREVLDLDFDKMKKIAKIDRIKSKYGDLPEELTHKNPELAPIERAWPHLSAQHKKDLITMIIGWAKQDRSATT